MRGTSTTWSSPPTAPASGRPATTALSLNGTLQTAPPPAASPATASGVNVLALNEVAGWLAYGALDGGTRVIDLGTGETIADLTAGRRPILAMARSPTGHRLAVGDGEGYIMVVETAAWRIHRDFRAALNGPIWALAFTPTGEGIVAAGIANEAMLWPLDGTDSAPRLAEIRREFHTDPDAVPNGERQFLRKCSICHTLGPDGERRAGPPLAGLFGRPAGSVPGYPYSDAIRNSGLVWTRETIDALFDIGPNTIFQEPRCRCSG